MPRVRGQKVTQSDGFARASHGLRAGEILARTSNVASYKGPGVRPVSWSARDLRLVFAAKRNSCREKDFLKETFRLKNE